MNMEEGRMGKGITVVKRRGGRRGEKEEKSEGRVVSSSPPFSSDSAHLSFSTNRQILPLPHLSLLLSHPRKRQGHMNRERRRREEG